MRSAHPQTQDCMPALVHEQIMVIMMTYLSHLAGEAYCASFWLCFLKTVWFKMYRIWKYEVLLPSSLLINTHWRLVKVSLTVLICVFSHWGQLVIHSWCVPLMCVSQNMCQLLICSSGGAALLQHSSQLSHIRPVMSDYLQPWSVLLIRREHNCILPLFLTSCRPKWCFYVLFPVCCSIFWINRKKQSVLCIESLSTRL